MKKWYPFITLLILVLLAAPHASAQWSNGKTADLVLGQADFVSRNSGTDASHFNGPNGIAIDPVSRKLFVVDRTNHRILRFGVADGLISGAAAEAVFGQTDFAGKSSGADATKFNNPIGICFDPQGRLWVGDFSNNRVLRFDDAANKASGAAADGVLGQPDLISKAAATTPAGMSGPVAPFIDMNGTLWVAQFNNHRVTRYDNAAAKANGADADGVLGQPDFTTSSSGLSASKMNNPNSLFMDGEGTLWISEYTNRRVLRFDNAAAKSNGAAADGVLGQPDFTTNAATTTQSGMNSVRFVIGDARGTLYVVEEPNHRVLIFQDSHLKPNGGSADYVLGQSDFVSKLNPIPPTESSFNIPRAAFYDELKKTLWICDFSNNRVLRFTEMETPAAPEPFHWVNTQAAEVVIGQADFSTYASGVSASQFNTPQAICYHPPSGKLFVSDRLNNRVLRFSSAAAITSGSSAEAVLGQPDFTSKTAAVTAAGMNAPIGLAIEEDGTLWVGDYSNKRVLRFDDAVNIPSGSPANGVLGKADFITNTGTVSQTAMGGPVGITIHPDGTLWVADFSAQRMLRYDDAKHKSNGAPADGILGQPDFTTTTARTTADGVNGPNNIYIDLDGTLWVCEFTNNRVVRYDDAAHKPNGAPADGVLGQPDFVSKTAATTQTGMRDMRAVFGNGSGQIYTAEDGNNRVLIFNDAAKLANGAPADWVLGQPDFITRTGVTPPTASTLRQPRGLAIDNLNRRVWITDSQNNRVLLYTEKPYTPPEKPVYTTQPLDLKLFTESRDLTFWDHSWGYANAPSLLERYNNNDKIPVDTSEAYSGETSLRLAWTSRAGGEWGMAVASANWVKLDLSWKDSLAFLVHSATALSPRELPALFMEDVTNARSEKIALSAWVDTVKADYWTRIAIPLQAFFSGTSKADPKRIKTIFFAQGEADDKAHALLLDEIRFTGGSDFAGKRVVVVLGAGVPEGAGATVADSSWVGRYRTQLTAASDKFTVINLGVGGVNTYRLLPDASPIPAGVTFFPWENNNLSFAAAFKPEAVIVNLSFEDADQAFTKEAQLANLDSLAAFASRNKITLWLTTTMPRAFTDAAKKQNLLEMRDAILVKYSHVINLWPVLADAQDDLDPLFKAADGFNLNNAGHAAVYNTMLAAEIVELPAPKPEYVLNPLDVKVYTDSRTGGYWDSSWGYVNAPSTLELYNGDKYPLTSDYLYDGLYNLKLHWTSKAGGDWAIAVANDGWLKMDATWKDSLAFLVYTTKAIPAASLPKVFLEDISSVKTDRFPLSDYHGDIPAHAWTRIVVPLQPFFDHPGQAKLYQMKTVFFSQNAADGEEHTLYIDEVRLTGGKTYADKQVVVVIGSSTAEGTGASPADSAWVNRYRSYLQKYSSEFEVINLAIGGFSSFRVMPTGYEPPPARPFYPRENNNITFALAFHPKAIIVNMPSNDAANYFTIAEQVANFDTLAAYAKRYQVPVWFSTTQPRNFTDASQRTNLMVMRDSIISRYSNKEWTRVIDFWNGLSDASGNILPAYNSGDGVHLNNKGHRLLYERVVEAHVLVYTGTGQLPELLPEAYQLYHNYPNPFNPSTTIRYDLPKNSPVHIAVYDITGREVAVLHDGLQQAGRHAVIWNASSVASGLYIVKIQSADWSQVNKMMLIK
jgi:sugar lactone lactonase YvrE/lysophospholipase L1-like esterase